MAYVYAVTAFLLARLFIPYLDSRTAGFLNRANLIMLVVLAADLVLSACSIAFMGFYEIGVRAWTFVVCLVVGYMFLKRKNRSKPIFTFIGMMLLPGWKYKELALIWITHFDKDILPSYWIVYYPVSGFLLSFLTSSLYFLICWLGVKPVEKAG